MNRTPFATKTGTVHLTEGRASIARGNQALCGRVLEAWSTFSEEKTAMFLADHVRLGKTHETGLCRRCFDKEAQR